MADATIRCPHCHKEFKLTESLAAPLVEKAREQFELAGTAREAALAKREAELLSEKEKMRQDRAAIEQEVAKRVSEQRKSIATEEAKKAREILKLDIERGQQDVALLQEVLADRDKKLAAAQAAQAELERKKRELDDARRELELKVQKGISAGLAAEKDKARKEADERARLVIAERDLKIAAMSRQIDELKQKAEQGSQQTQGEVQELDLHARLSDSFPDDEITAVGIGQNGGDIVQHVVGPHGKPVGKILWESKRTKRFSQGWLAKLRDNQRTEKAEIAILVTQALPPGVETFDQIDGVWVAHPSVALPVAMALRQLVLGVAAARQATMGKQSKMALVYEYLTGSQFRQHIEAIIEAYKEMRVDLDRERTALTKLWARREQQLQRMLYATSSMCGDLEGIAGRSLREIEGLGLKQLAAASVAEGGRKSMRTNGAVA